MDTKRYVIQGGAQGRERLRILAGVMGAQTRALLDAVGIPSGASCLDVGCGGGDVSIELARRVGASGRVTGVDLDETKIQIAREEAEQHGLTQVSFDVRDVTAWEPDAQFDVVYARFLLTHLSHPGPLVAAFRRHLRPGGVVIVEDIDFRGHFAEPECPALTRFVELYSASVRRRGADPNIGPRLPALLRDGGFADVHLRLAHPVAMQGGIKLLTCITLESIADAVVKDGLITDAELRKTIDELRAFAADPHTVLGGPRVFQAWSRA